MQTLDYDIAVVGGGLAGATLACALSGTGYSVALIEAEPFAAALDANRQVRNIAIAWGTRKLFENLDLWAGMQSAAEPIERLHVSQKGHWGSVRVRAADYQLPALGYVVPNTAMLKSIRDQLVQMKHVDVIAPARFSSLKHHPDHVELSIQQKEGPQQLRTKLLVGADGARSSVREALGITTQTDNYHQSAVVTSVQQEYAHLNEAFERFTPRGPLAVLPRTKNSCAIIWTLPSEQAKRTKALSEARFLSELQADFGDRLGQLKSLGPRGMFPLYRVLAAKANAHRALLIGNAGHFLHPAAAQGFNLSIRDVLLLASMLKQRGGDPGDADLLAHWAQAREPDQLRVANFTDKIVRIFSNDLPIGFARSIGLLGLSLCPEVKHGMARRSMGLASSEFPGV